MVCARELKNAIGARVDNIYELDGVLFFRLRLQGGGRQDLLMEPGRRAYLTGMEYTPPKKPSDCAMLLRKHLINARLSAVEQPDFERIIEFRFSGKEDRVLDLELFGKGNLVLCDSEFNIIQPYRREIWRHRVIKPGERYAYPPKKGIDVRDLDASGLRRAMEGAPDVVRALAINLNMGGPLAEEICARAPVQKGRRPGELSGQEIEAIIEAIKSLFSQEPAARIVYENDRPVDVLPFDFKVHLGKRVKRFDTFNEALDEYFGTLGVTSAAEKQRKRLEREVKRLRKRLAEQEKHFADLCAKSSTAKQKADLAAIHHAQINEILNFLSDLRRARGWRGAIEGLEKAKGAGESWAGGVKKVDAHAAKIELEVAGQPITLDLRLSVFENASRLYKQYKKMAEKAAGARDALEQTKRELDRLLTVGASELESPVPRKRRKPKWFEQFRWFISSDGLLVIAGRDARTNQEVVERHMESSDRYLHADIVGAPHVVIKAAGREVPENTLREAAEFAAMHSRAWREGLGELDVYWALPEQVSKRAPAGEYLPPGAYMIRGKRNFVKVPMRAAVGVMMLDNGQVVICGPPSAVEKHSRVVVRVTPRPIKKSDLAKAVQARLKGAGVDASIDELMRALPPGGGNVVKPRGEVS